MWFSASSSCLGCTMLKLLRPCTTTAASILETPTACESESWTPLQPSSEPSPFRDRMWHFQSSLLRQRRGPGLAVSSIGLRHHRFTRFESPESNWPEAGSHPGTMTRRRHRAHRRSLLDSGRVRPTSPSRHRLHLLALPWLIADIRLVAAPDVLRRACKSTAVPAPLPVFVHVSV